MTGPRKYGGRAGYDPRNHVVYFTRSASDNQPDNPRPPDTKACESDKATDD